MPRISKPCTTFTAAVREQVKDHCHDKTFCYLDFSRIADKYGKHPKSATHVLRDMTKAGMLVEVARPFRPNGKDRTKFYKIANGARFDVKPAKSEKKEVREAWEKSKTEKERQMTACAQRISDALDRMSNGRKKDIQAGA